MKKKSSIQLTLGIMATMFFASTAQATLLGLWEFDEGSGTSANSSVGGHTGTLIDFTDTSAGAGDAVGTSGWTTDGRLNFLGPGAGADRVETSFPLSLLQNSDFTVEYTMTHNDAAQNWSPVIGQSGGCCFFIGKRSGTQQIHANLNGLGSIDSPVLNYSDGQMHHVAVVFDDTADTLTAFFDQVQVAQINTAGALNDQGNLWIGAVAHQPVNETNNGFVGAVAISDSVLGPGLFVIPEPSSLGLVLVGLLTLGLGRRCARR